MLIGLIPGLITSALFLLGMVVLFVPGGLLALLFIVATEADDTIIQIETVQDGRACIEIHYAGIGAWSSGWGFIEIKKQYWWLPLIEKSIWSGKSWSPREEGPFVELINGRRLRFSHRSRRPGEDRIEPADTLLRF